MKIQNEYGTIFITGEVFSDISGHVATNCFGVKGMSSRSVRDGIVRVLRGDKMSKGIKISYDNENENERLNVELHIVVEHGVNIPVLCNSIMSEVRYILEKITGVTVGTVNVCVDSIMSDE